MRALRRKDLEEISVLKSEKQIRRTLSGRAHPLEEELERFKIEFKARQDRLQELHRNGINEVGKKKNREEPLFPEDTNSTKAKRDACSYEKMSLLQIPRSSSYRENSIDLRRFPELKFNQRAGRSLSPTRIVILKPSVDSQEDVFKTVKYLSEEVRERPKPELLTRVGGSMVVDLQIPEVGTHEAGRKSTGSTLIGDYYGFSNGMRGDLEVRTLSFREGQRDQDLSFNLGRCFSEPISGAVLGRVLLEEQGKPMRFELTEMKERKKPKKDFFNLKGRVSYMRRVLTLGRKLFSRKNRAMGESLDITVTSPLVQLSCKDNSTEVPPSPASISSYCENGWKPTFPSPISPLETPFNDDLPRIPEEICVLVPEVQRQSPPTSLRHEAVSNLQGDEDNTSYEENYLRRALVTSGHYNQPLNLILALCNSPMEPLAEWVFKETEKSTNHTNQPVASSSRRLLFDLLNEQLLCLVSAPVLNSKRIIPLVTGEDLMRTLMKQLERCLSLNKRTSSSLESLISRDLSEPGIIVHVSLDDVCESVEGIILSRLIDEFVCDLC
ncbi:RB1-inducible coiled-coil protein [Wolffia australiana]